MAKTIPKKKVAKKQSDREIQTHLKLMDKKAEERWLWVQELSTPNDVTFTDALDLMVENLKVMQGPPRLVIDGQTYPVSEQDFKLLRDIQERNFYWIAMRCIVACAEWDIRIAGFKAPTKLCMRCGKRVK